MRFARFAVLLLDLRRVIRLAVFGIAALLCFASVARAQISSVNDTTSTPVPGSGHDYIKMLNETVSPANGSVSLRIEVPVPKGRGLTLPFSFAYDSNGVFTPWMNNVSGATATQNTNEAFLLDGWSYGLPLMSVVDIVVSPRTKLQPECDDSTGYVFQSSAGGRYFLPVAGARHFSVLYPECEGNSYPSGSNDFYQAHLSTTDSAGDTYNGKLTVASSAGTVYTFGGGGCTGYTGRAAPASSIEDSNGNVISLTTSNCSAFTATDTAGRTVLSASGFGTTGNTVTVSGLSQPYTLTWGTASQNFTMGSTHPAGNPSYCGSGFSGTAGSIPVVTAIQLPNGQQYQFSYDGTYGLLSKITYPTGGYISYTWGPNTQSEYVELNGGPSNPAPPNAPCDYTYDSIALSHRYVSFDGVHNALQQDFNYSTVWNYRWTTKTTTVTTHDLIRGTSFQTIYTYTPVDAPCAPDTCYYYPGQIPLESTIVYKDTNGSTLRTVTKTWHDQYELGREQTALDNGQTSKVEYTYGPGGVVTEKDEYDFGSGAPGGLLRKTVNTYQTFPNTPIFSTTSSILDRPCKTIIYDSAGTNRVAETDTLYDGGTTVCGTAGTPSVSSVSGMPTGSHDETNYSSTSAAPRGNATKVIKNCFVGTQTCASGNPTSTFTYDETGQTLTMTDPRSNVTQYSYADSYTSGTPPGNTNAYLTQLTYPPTNGVAHIENFSYGYADGQVTQSKDQNSQVTTYKYVDNLGRLTETDSPDGGQINLTYNDAAPAPSITTSEKLNLSQTMTSVSIKDGLGHVTQTQLTSDPQGTVYTLATYDGLGRTYKAYNPYRSTSDSTYGFTTYNYDSLNRTTTVADPDGSVVQTQYCGASTLVTDPASHWRRSRTDALGRLVEVDEPNSTTATVNVCPGSNEPIWVTSYAYDTLGDLTGVVQGGSRPRSFIYDSLRRLTSSTNPESNASGTATVYTYDANGNVTSKTDARGLTTNYSPSGSPIDALNRVTSITYSDTTPTVNYTYDQSACLGQPACYNVGRRTTMTDGGGSENLSYDKMGRELTELRTANGLPETTTYATQTAPYNYDGSISQLTYPSGRTITYAYDNAGRPSTAKDVANGINYALGSCGGGACYAPQGGLSQVQNGTNLVSTYIYSSRLQPCWLFASTSVILATSTSCTAIDPGPGNILDLKYSFNLGAGDNGNVMNITNNRDTNRTQTFTYDQVNRILTAQTSATTGPNCWGETFTMDQWANMTAIGGLSAYTGCTQENLSVSATTNNQLSATGLSYDLSGNMLTDGLYTYSYNAESEIKSAAGVNYTYDGDGNRVQKSNGKIYWYGAGTEILDESDLSGNFTSEYVFFGGKRIARRDVASGNIFYYAEDMLGSSRTLVQAGQTTPCYDADFYPYGGERDIVNTCPQNYKFEGKERDTETNTDDFGARYYSSRFGRWLSADWSAVPEPVPYANLTNPQTLNLYAMVSDNPETFADLDGHGTDPMGDHESTCLCTDVTADDQENATTDGKNKSVPQDQRQNAGQPPPAATVGTETTMEEVNRVVQPLIDSAVEDAGAAAGVLSTAAAAVVVAVGELLNPAPVNVGEKQALNDAKASKEQKAKEGSTDGPGSGKRATPSQRKQTLKENNGKCVFCGKKATQADHAIPKSRGGDTTSNNLQPTCQSCNQQKGTKTTQEYLQWKNGQGE
jgi:RHS repeat-associated protein